MTSWITVEIRPSVPNPFSFSIPTSYSTKMSLHPEILWAQRSSESVAEKVVDSSTRRFALFLISGFSADGVERLVSDGQPA